MSQPTKETHSAPPSEWLAWLLESNELRDLATAAEDKHPDKYLLYTAWQTRGTVMRIILSENILIADSPAQLLAAAESTVSGWARKKLLALLAIRPSHDVDTDGDVPSLEDLHLLRIAAKLSKTAVLASPQLGGTTLHPSWQIAMVHPNCSQKRGEARRHEVIRRINLLGANNPTTQANYGPALLESVGFRVAHLSLGQWDVPLQSRVRDAALDHLYAPSEPKIASAA